MKYRFCLLCSSLKSISKSLWITYWWSAPNVTKSSVIGRFSNGLPIFTNASMFNSVSLVLAGFCVPKAPRWWTCSNWHALKYRSRNMDPSRKSNAHCEYYEFDWILTARRGDLDCLADSLAAKLIDSIPFCMHSILLAYNSKQILGVCELTCAGICGLCARTTGRISRCASEFEPNLREHP